MSVVVECRTEDGQVVEYFGPFEDDSWANAWLKQHRHNPMDGLLEEEDISDDRLGDPDHWCAEVEDSTHYIHSLIEPGFDPDTHPEAI